MPERGFAVVIVHVGVVGAPSPADEQPEGQQDNDDAYGGLGDLLHDLRQVAIEEHQRDAQDHERSAVAEAPEEAQKPAFLTRRWSSSEAISVVIAAR